MRSEIRSAKQAYIVEGKSTEEAWEEVSLCYDELDALPYLDAVLKETLRVYPPSSVHFRRYASMSNFRCISSNKNFHSAQQDTTLPLQYPVKGVDGTPISAIPLEKGTDVMVSIIASNRNREVWGEDADDWKPERWISGSVSTDKDSTVKYPGVYSSM